LQTAAIFFVPGPAALLQATRRASLDRVPQSSTYRCWPEWEWGKWDYAGTERGEEGNNLAGVAVCRDGVWLQI